MSRIDRANSLFIYAFGRKLAVPVVDAPPQWAQLKFDYIRGTPVDRGAAMLWKERLAAKFMHNSKSEKPWGIGKRVPNGLKATKDRKVVQIGRAHV